MGLEKAKPKKAFGASQNLCPHTLRRQRARTLHRYGARCHSAIVFRLEILVQSKCCNLLGVRGDRAAGLTRFYQILKVFYESY
jgi:hypothetical protein